MKVLLVEDDLKLSAYLKKLFLFKNINLDHIDNGLDVDYYTRHNDYDIIILDWMLPGKDGITVCEELRKNDFQGGILMLTARTMLVDKIQGLNIGADDYLIKPFEFEELYARISSLKRRVSQKFIKDEFVLDDFIFNCSEKSVSYHEKKIRLTTREFQILELIARNAKQIITREVLIDRIWGMEKDITNNSIDAYIKLIRKKLEQISNKKLVHNARSVGYYWEKIDV